MAYADQQMSGNRVVAIIIVALIHIALGYALITGLAYNAVQQVVERVTTIDIEEPPPPEEELGAHLITGISGDVKTTFDAINHSSVPASHVMLFYCKSWEFSQLLLAFFSSFLFPSFRCFKDSECSHVSLVLS